MNTFNSVLKPICNYRNEEPKKWLNYSRKIFVFYFIFGGIVLYIVLVVVLSKNKRTRAFNFFFSHFVYFFAFKTQNWLWVANIFFRLKYAKTKIAADVACWKQWHTCVIRNQLQYMSTQFEVILRKKEETIFSFRFLSFHLSMITLICGK